MASVGLGKNFSRYSISGMYGIVPSEISGGPLIETVTLRQTYRYDEWDQMDFYLGLNIFHVLGLNYQTTKFRDAPKSYYPIGSIRALLNLGLAINMGKDKKNAFYLEAGLNDIWITNFLTNSREVNPYDHGSLGMGFKFGF